MQLSYKAHSEKLEQPKAKQAKQKEKNENLGIEPIAKRRKVSNSNRDILEKPRNKIKIKK